MKSFEKFLELTGYKSHAPLGISIPNTIGGSGILTPLQDLEKIEKDQETSKIDKKFKGNKKSFKEWIKIEEDVEIIESMISQGSEYLTNMPPNKEANGELDKIVSKLLSILNKIDKWIGMKKFLTIIPKTLYANIMLIVQIGKFSKNPLDKEVQKNLLYWMSENGKLSIYSGASIPVAIFLGNLLGGGIGQLIGGLVAKGVSYGYFYLGQWAENMQDNPKYGEFAKKILKTLPQTIIKKNENNDLNNWLPQVTKKAQIQYIDERKNPIMIFLSDKTRLYMPYDAWRRKGKPGKGATVIVTLQRREEDRSETPSQVSDLKVI